MKNKKQFIIRFFLFILGLFISGVGVAITKRGELGVSPVSSVANILSIRFSSLTLGNWLIIWNCVLILGQVVVLGRRFKVWQLLQIPLSFMFGWFTDVGMTMARTFPVDYYWERCLWVVAGTLVLSFGITMTVKANVIMNSGEAFVKAVSDRSGRKFSTIKIIFDVTCVSLSVILSLILYRGRILGTREGTVFAAIMTGVFVKMWSRFYK